MSSFEILMTETKVSRGKFLSTPILKHVIEKGIDRPLYLAYLEQAYHHVKETCPLLAAAASRCTSYDSIYQQALFDYIGEEKGHEFWILDDIQNLGGDIINIRHGQGDETVRIMVGYARYAIDHISPYSLLGMVHVLEGMSVILADKAAKAIMQSNELSDGKGFSYLTSHGALDQEHVKFFENLINKIDDPETLNVIIDSANIIYRLFGEMFNALDPNMESQPNVI